MGNGESAPARLPSGAPDGLRAFVACTENRLEFSLGEQGWIPLPDGVPDALTPEVSVSDGWTSSGATIRLGWGPFMGVDIPATIVDGELRVDSAGLGFGIGEHIDPWVDAFNRTMREKNKRLESFDVSGGKVIMTKRVVPAITDESASTAPIASTVGAPKKTEEPAGEPDPPWYSACPIWLLGVVVAIGVAIGIIVLVTSDSGGDDTITTGTPVVTEAPPVDSAVTDPPATESPVDTTSSLNTDPPGETDPPVDSAPSVDTDPPVETDPASDEQAQTDEPTPLEVVLIDLVDSMTPLIPTDGGTLAEDGAFVETTEGFMPFDVEMWAGIVPNERIVFYIEGPTDVVTQLAFEFDVVAPDGFTTLAETGLIGDGGPYPSWALTAPVGTLLTLGDHPIPFEPLPERIGGLISTDISSASDADAATSSNWLYASLDDANLYTYGHLEFSLSEVTSPLDLVPLREVSDIDADNARIDAIRQQIRDFLDTDDGAVAWIDAID